MPITAKRPTGLFAWVQSNYTRSIIYFLGFAAAFQVIAATILAVPLAVIDEAHSPLYGPAGYALRYVPVIFALTLVWFGLQLWWYANTVQKAAGFHFVDADDEPRLCAAIERLLITMGLPAPFVGVIESPAMNAFACGISTRKSVVVVTRGLINGLNDKELEAVLAHELVHIKNGDIRLMAAANICLSNLRAMHRFNPLHFRNPIHALVCVGFPVFFPLMLIGGLVGQVAIRSAYGSRLVISSAREFVADAEAARVTKNPASLASALFRVEGKHRIHTGEHESDAMMIAGDSEGASATHPDIAERVDALARTTGSMVFNAPGAHEKAKSERFQRQAAGGESADTPSILERIGGVGGENIFGFTKLGLGLFLAALAFSLVAQSKDLLNPSAMIARMDVRPFGYALGLGDIACMVEGKDWTCRDDIVYDWSQYEDQTGTYLGYMAKGRAERQARNEERVAQLTKEHKVQSQPYTGLSGLMRDYSLDTASNGEFLYAENGYTRLWTKPPVEARIEETRRVGCFTEKLFYGDNFEAEFKREGDIGVSDLGTYIDEVTKASQIALIDGDEGLETYFQTRLSNTRVAFDLFGLEGLRAMEQALAAPTHIQAVTLLAKRVDDPGFLSGKSELRQAELKALVTRPERFVPCLALRGGAR